MKIALCHYRVGETDGVSLEMDKWAYTLEQLGHEVVYIAGESGTSERKTFIIEETAILYPMDEELRFDMYHYQTMSEEDIINKSNKIKVVVKEKLLNIVKENNIDMLVPNNILCMGRSIPIGEAYAEVIRELDLPVVNHHHDFFWEREFFSASNYPYVKKSLSENFPPAGDKIKHCVINTQAGKDLLDRRGLNSTVVPNVFDFEQEPWKADEYNADFRASFGIDDDAIVFLQGTRLVARKGVELAIDVMNEINKLRNNYIGKALYNGKVISKDTRFVYLLVGLHEDHGDYVELIKQKCIDMNIDFILDPTKVAHERTSQDGDKIYSLWDAYVHSDFVMYPSIYEGFGNQLLEAVFAKIPTLIFEYSVYVDDIKPTNCDFVSLGDKYEVGHDSLVKVDESITKACAVDVMDILCNKERYTMITDKNFEICKSHFSYETLKNILTDVFDVE